MRFECRLHLFPPRQSSMDAVTSAYSCIYTHYRRHLICLPASKQTCSMLRARLRLQQPPSALRWRWWLLLFRACLFSSESTECALSAAGCLTDDIFSTRDERKIASVSNAHHLLLFITPNLSVSLLCLNHSSFCLICVFFWFPYLLLCMLPAFCSCIMSRFSVCLNIPGKKRR